MIGAPRDPRSEAKLEGTPTTAFGKYQLFASLGRGGMADVFLSVARGQMGFNKLAVIKRLRQALAEEAAFRTMFLDEARLAARLGHPNIVHTYEVGEQNGVYFIAMEYLEGQSLNKVLKEALRRREVIEPVLCARIVADALAGLGYAHTLADYDGRPLNIIHRDVSPHNVFVTYDGHTKLVDFGIAKAASSSTETEVGVLKGKVAYMSPEQAMGVRIDARADLFAMGIVLWELIARQRLMTGESAANTLHKLMNEPIPRVSQVVPDIDPALDALVARALEKDPDHRFQNAAEMREALERWIVTQGVPARQEEVGKKMQGLFANVREEVQRQIQRHMAALNNASTTQELQALTAESLHRMEQSGANLSGQLLRLNGSGSGSGVVPSYGMGHPGMAPSSGPYPAGTHGHSTPGMMPYPQQAQPQRQQSALMIVIAIGFFALAGIGIVVFGLRDRWKKPEPVSIAPTETLAPLPVPVPTETASSAAPTATTAPPTATATPTAIPTASATATTPATATAQPVPTHHATATAAPKPTTPPKPTTAPTAPPENDEKGFLTITVTPWAKVSEGGRVLCASTPCNKIPLAPGTHALTLENPEQNLKQSVTVTIKSGETTAKAYGFK